MIFQYKSGKQFKNFKFAQADEVNSGEDRERERRISEEVRRTSVANYSTHSLLRIGINGYVILILYFHHINIFLITFSLS